MYDYQSYLSGNRSLLGANGPGYEYAPQFPSHLRQWQEQGYDKGGISQYLPTKRRRSQSYYGPGGNWSRGIMPPYGYQVPRHSMGARISRYSDMGPGSFFGRMMPTPNMQYQPPQYGLY